MYKMLNLSGLRYSPRYIHTRYTLALAFLSHEIAISVAIGCMDWEAGIGNMYKTGTNIMKILNIKGS